MVVEEVEGHRTTGGRRGDGEEDLGAVASRKAHQVRIETLPQVPRQDPGLAAAAERREQHVAVLDRRRVESHPPGKVPLALVAVLDGRAVGRLAQFGIDPVRKETARHTLTSPR